MKDKPDKTIEVWSKWQEIGEDQFMLLRSFDKGENWEYFKTAHTKNPVILMNDESQAISQYKDRVVEEIE
jgi:hypothetical protein